MRRLPPEDSAQEEGSVRSFPSPHRENCEESVGLVFLRVYNRWHGELQRRLKAVGVTHPQFVILATLGYLTQFSEEITQVMLAGMAGMDVMSVSQILILLEKRGDVRRRAHSRDTRANVIRLTPQGAEKMGRALPVVEEVDRLFFGSLGEAGAEFKGCLDRLKRYEF